MGRLHGRTFSQAVGGSDRSVQRLRATRPKTTYVTVLISLQNPLACDQAFACLLRRGNSSDWRSTHGGILRLEFLTASPSPCLPLLQARYGPSSLLWRR